MAERLAEWLTSQGAMAVGLARWHNHSAIRHAFLAEWFPGLVTLSPCHLVTLSSSRDGVHDFALLHRPPDLRDGAVRRHHAGRRARRVLLADGAVPADLAAAGAGGHHLPGGQRPGGGGHGGGADRAAGQRRAGHAVHDVALRQQRHLHAVRHLRGRREPQHRPGHGAEPRAARDAALAHVGPEPGDHHPQEDPRHLDGRQPVFSGRPLRPALPEQLRADQRLLPAPARGRRVGHQPPGWALVQHARLARPAEADRAQPERRGRGHGGHQSEPASGPWADRTTAVESTPGL